jgi:hypothetical protein
MEVRVTHMGSKAKAKAFKAEVLTGSVRPPRDQGTFMAQIGC